MKRRVNEILGNLPRHKYPVENQEIRKLRGDRVIIVLDDDPTGTQTVSNVPVLTEWSLENLTSEFNKGSDLFYILTNSRSMPPGEARQITREITQNIDRAAKKANKKFILISRSDSTLRGHYPLETDTIAEVLKLKNYITIINPAFFEGGRISLDNQHYVIENGFLIKASETPFSKDEVFGYKESDLYNFVIEKSENRIKREDIFDLSVHELRNEPEDKLVNKLISNQSKKVLIINSVDYDDERKAVYCVLKALNQGVNFLFRTAASIVPVMGNIPEKPVLQRSDFKTGTGVIVVGSHVPKTTRQLNFLLNNTDLRSLELQVDLFLNEEKMNSLVSRVSRITSQEIKKGNSVVIFTSRDLVKMPDKHKNLDLGKRVSDGIVRIIKNLESDPSYIIAKGGITSSDIATKALNIKRAMVRGQILPGVPVWKPGAETLFPGINYVVFPGNVGDDKALYNAYEKFK